MRDLDRRFYWGMLALPIILYVAVFLAPLANAFLLSFRQGQRLGQVGEEFTAINYTTIFTDPYYLAIWSNTVTLALVASVLAVVIGSIVAFVMWDAGGMARKVTTFLMIASFMMSGVVRGVGMIGFVGPVGITPWLSAMLGLGNISLSYSKPAIVLGFVHSFTPVAYMLVMARLDGIPNSILQAAQDLGARARVRLQRVVLPLAVPGLVAAVLLVFALASASYVLPAILGGRRTMVLARAIFQEQFIIANGPMAAALSTVLIVLTVGVMVTQNRVAKHAEQRIES